MSRSPWLADIGPLSSTQLLRIIQSDPVLRRSPFAGIFPKDQFTLKAGANRWAILNLADWKADGTPASGSGGTHYVLWHDVDPNQTIYVDSYGFAAPGVIERLMAATGKRTRWSMAECQDQHSNCCGIFALHFAKQLLLGRSLDAITSEDFWPYNKWLDGLAMNDYVLGGQFKFQ